MVLCNLPLAIVHWRLVKRMFLMMQSLGRSGGCREESGGIRGESGREPMAESADAGCSQFGCWQILQSLFTFCER